MNQSQVIETLRLTNVPICFVYSFRVTCMNIYINTIDRYMICSSLTSWCISLVVSKIEKTLLTHVVYAFIHIAVHHIVRLSLYARAVHFNGVLLNVVGDIRISYLPTSPHHLFVYCLLRVSTCLSSPPRNPESFSKTYMNMLQHVCCRFVHSNWLL